MKPSQTVSPTPRNIHKKVTEILTVSVSDKYCGLVPLRVLKSKMTTTRITPTNGIKARKKYDGNPNTC